MDLTAEDLKELVGIFKKIYEDNEGKPFPQDPKEQLIEAVKAVFRSWDNPRANVYRKMNEIPYEWGTAVNVQQMAFGNSGDQAPAPAWPSPATPPPARRSIIGEYLINAQGEDVVAGVRTPSPISQLHEEMPEVYDQFVQIATRLENYFTRYAGHGVHHRGRQAVYAADPQRQAHRSGRAEDRHATWWTRA